MRAYDRVLVAVFGGNAMTGHERHAHLRHMAVDCVKNRPKIMLLVNRPNAMHSLQPEWQDEVAGKRIEIARDHSRARPIEDDLANLFR